MGATDIDGTTLPVHAVAVPAFAISRTEVTVCSYAACMRAGSCTAPSSACTQAAGDAAVACVSWDQSTAYCGWAGGRLCTEAEWEFAARNGAADNLNPWGDADPTCADAVFTDPDVGCSATTPAAACSTPAGNDAWGVCDLAGNVMEWVEDDWHDSYVGAPSDGSAWVDSPRGTVRVMRGGSYLLDTASMRASERVGVIPSGNDYDFGARCCVTR
jgi:formylglycine-generating enzyme required for sulfatase activity